MPQSKISEFQIPDQHLQNDSSIDKVRLDVYKAYGFENAIPEKHHDVKNESLTINIVEGIYGIGEQLEQDRTNYISKMPAGALDHINNVKNFMANVSGLLFSNKVSTLSNRDVAKNNLITQESKIGASIFGHVSSKTSRYEFFYEGRDERAGVIVDNWFYHEEKIVGGKKEHTSRTLHYEVLPDGVYLVGDGYLNDEQTDKFWQITKSYQKNVRGKIYFNKERLESKGLSIKATKKIIKFIDKNRPGSGNQVA